MVLSIVEDPNHGSKQERFPIGIPGKVRGCPTAYPTTDAGA